MCNVLIKCLQLPKSSLYKGAVAPNDVAAASNFVVGNVLLPGWKDRRWAEQPHLMHQIAALGSPNVSLPGVPPSTSRPGFCPPIPVGRFYPGEYPVRLIFIYTIFHN